MTIYNMSKMLAGVQPRFLPGGSGINVLSTLAFLAVALANGDTINALNIGSDAAESAGAGPFMQNVTVDTDQLDTGNTASFVAGDSVTNNRYIVTSTLMRTGGIVQANALGGVVGFQPFATTFNNYPSPSLATYTISVFVTATATTPKAGSLRVMAEYTYDP